MLVVMQAARTGTHDALTDVPGIRVGHATRDEPGWLTGTTVVLPPPETVGGIDVRGGGPGTRESDLLDPRHLVDAVDAVVLTGGSAFGLGTADGVMAELFAQGRGWPAGQTPEQVVPIVPAMVLFDLGRGGTWEHHPGPDEGRAAVLAATDGPVPVGSVGAGCGAAAGGLRGGIGTASAVLEDGTTVAALVACNALGSPLAADGRLLAHPSLSPAEQAALGEPDPDRVAEHRRRRAQAAAALRAGTATTIGVVATDADLDKAACSMLARVAHDGLARAVSPVHTAFDGDTFVGLSTRARGRPDPLTVVELQTEAAHCVTRAVARALLAVTTLDRSGDAGEVLTAYRDLLRPDEAG